MHNNIDEINKVLSSLVKERAFQHFSSKIKFSHVKFIVLSTSSNLQRGIYCRNIYVSRLSRIILRSISYCRNEAGMCSANEKLYLAPNMCPYVRDLIARGIKFTSSRDETQLKHLAFVEEPWSKIKAPEARLRRKVGVSFPKHFPFIRHVFAVLAAPSSGLSGKKPTPVPARTRFNSDAL